MAVVSNSEIAPSVRCIELDYRPRFLPGQCVAVALDGCVRYYSIAGAPGADSLSILYDVISDGELTPKLAACVPSDRVLVSEPFGSFVLDTSAPDQLSKPVTCIATGTGVAPFLSMARSLPSDLPQSPGIRLLHGARRVSGLYFGEELHRALGPNYVPCMSVWPGTDGDRRVLDRFHAFNGRLTALLRQEGGDPAGLHFLCGSAAMVVDVRDLLVSLGVPFDNIFSEIYF